MYRKMRWGHLHLHGRHEINPVKVVSDAVVASKQIGDGRLCPLLVLDTTDRPDIEELIEAHDDFTAGDVKTQWVIANRFDREISLYLSFERPMQVVVIIRFDIVTKGILVDQILNTQLLFLQAGREGDRLISSPNAKKIYVEVPESGFREVWDGIYQKQVATYMRDRGFKRAESKRAAAQHIDQLRDFMTRRMP